MKPTVFQRIFARDWVWTAGFLGFAVGLTLAIAMQAPDRTHTLTVIAGGAAASAAVSWTLFKVLWFFRVRANGGPFRKGDLTQVIAGTYAGRQGYVYDEWQSRNQVRIRLDDSASKGAKDVFSQRQLIRVPQ
jgi:hypothetical protein